MQLFPRMYHHLFLDNIVLMQLTVALLAAGGQKERS